ncbi:hypothetical protein [Diplocloster agilis]|uniref:Uncharacterized protein n=1 Tax=Diplocloster agilis TaxID=2850323 RepID=A0A949NG18_9FIRM|nr:hypothetical protein [Diplocloster agilis]MBU9738319.1 hypothetical protein [Diplocloster agilis]
MNPNRSYLSAFLTACLIFVCMIPVQALAGGRTPSSEGNSVPEESFGPAVSCSSPEELVRLLSQDAQPLIVLNQDIEFNNKDFKIAATVNAEVDMGPYRIHIAKNASLSIEGPVHFKSEDPPAPAFLADGRLSIRNNAAISAYGQEATAIQVGESGSCSASHASILAEGPLATALTIKSTNLCVIAETVIYANGRDAVGIRTNAPLRLELSRVESEGSSILHDRNELILDTSAVIPEANPSAVIDRYPVLADRLDQNGLCYPQGTALPAKLPTELNYLFINAEDPSDQLYLSVPVIWEEYSEDMSVPGAYMLVCTPAVHPWFPVEIPSSMLMIHVISPNQPFLEGAYWFQDEIHLNFFSKLTEADQITLRYSTDGMVTYHNAAEDFSVFMDQNHAVLSSIPYLDYWFQLEVTGGPSEGLSNILYFSSASEDNNGFGGGDRDGGDTNDQDIPFVTPTPTEIPRATPSPSPPPLPGNDSSTDPQTEIDTDSSSPPPSASDPEPGIKPASESNSGTSAGKQTGNTGNPEQTAPSSSVTASAQTHPSDAEQSPAPTPDITEPPLFEQVTSTQTVISAKRLNELLKINSDYVLIEKDKIAVEFSTAFLKELAIDEDSMICILVEKIDDRSFLISLEIDNRPVTEIPGTVVRFPYFPDDLTDTGQLYFYCQETDTRTGAEYLSDSSTLRVEIGVSGAYFLEEKKKDRAVTETPGNLRLPIICLFGLIILCVILFCYYRSKRRTHEEP